MYVHTLNIGLSYLLNRRTREMRRGMIDVAFWSAMVVIVVLGTVGGILIKHGTNQFGAISLQRMLELNLSRDFFISMAILGLGIVLAAYGGLSLRDRWFAMSYLFTPTIFIGLVFLFFSRMLIGVPLSVTGLGRLTVVLTALLVAATVIASAIVFKEAFPPRVIVGIVLAVVAILLIGEA